MIQKVFTIMTYGAFALFLSTVALCSENEAPFFSSRPLLPSSAFERLPNDVLKNISINACIKDSILLTEVSRTLNKALQNDSQILANSVCRIPGHKRYARPTQNPGEDKQSFVQRLNAFYKETFKELKKPRYLLFFYQASHVAISAVSGDGTFFIAKYTKSDASTQHFIIQNKETPRLFPLNGLSSNNTNNLNISDISYDGRIAVGTEYNHERPQGIIWEYNEQHDEYRPRTLQIPDSEKLQVYSILGISSDNLTITGITMDDKIFQWTQTNGFQFLPFSENRSFWPSPTHVSGNGKTIICSVFSKRSKINQVLLEGSLKVEIKDDLKTSHQTLNPLPHHDSTTVVAINESGDVVAGCSNVENSLRRTNYAVIWPAGGTAFSLGVLTGDHQSNVKAISADGKVVTGNSERNTSSRISCCSTPYIWEAEMGMKSLINILASSKPHIVEIEPGSFQKTKYSDCIFIPSVEAMSDNGTDFFGIAQLCEIHPLGDDIPHHFKKKLDVAFSAYLPRYDIFAKEGFDLFKAKNETPMQSSNG